MRTRRLVSPSSPLSIFNHLDDDDNDDDNEEEELLMSAGIHSVVSWWSTAQL